MSGHKIIQGLTEAVATARIARLEAENARLREALIALLHTYDDGGTTLAVAFDMANAALKGASA